MLTLLLVASAAPHPLVSLEPDVPTSIPEGWRIVGRADPNERLELTFAVKQTNLRELHDTLMAVSTPSSPRYGQHLSNERVHALVAPKPADISTVEAFLRAGRLTTTTATPNRDLLSVTTTIGAAEALFDARYEELEHTVSGVRVHRCTRSGYRLPANVAMALDFVAPTVHVPSAARKTKHVLPEVVDDSVESPASGHNVPSTLRTLYSVGDSVVGTAASNKMAVTAFLAQFYSKSALHQYYTSYCSELTCGKGDPKLVGDATKGSPGVESMLDIESITGVAGNVSAEFWGFAGHSPDNPQNEPFLKWLTMVSTTGDADVPKLFSSSYGEDEASWSLPAATRLNVEFQKAGARGISLLYAAGDEGANCKGGKFVPEGPGSSPYVTSVGGTTAGPGYPTPGPDAEKAVGLSSGGFSDYWAMPEWQTSAVHDYLSTASDLPSASKRGYNVSGRAYPDISAQATNFCVTPFGCGVAGTSCASPTAAGIIALLNDLRLAAGKPTLGFLNPFIYANADAFNDITAGSSEGCGFSGGGWPASKGWDAVTGVGTPNYEKLAAAVAKLP